MKFAQFLSQLDPAPSFLPEVIDHPMWPEFSNSLEDFESFLRIHCDRPLDEVITEVRDLWGDFAREHPEAKHHLDLALAAWRDYAAHLQTCEDGVLERCEEADELLEHALEVSRFDDLDGASC
jgi:hypothetical protein